MANLQLKINSVDKSNLVLWSTLKKTEVLTKEPDTLEFHMHVHSGQTYFPAVGDTVQLYDTSSTLIFAGLVVELDSAIDGLLSNYRVICKDWTGLADAKLVAKTYTNKTATAIVQDIFTNYTSGFTTVNVNAPVTLDSMTFNYISVLQAMQKLIQAIGGGYDWYIDYNKDVHFYLTGSVTAPFNLDDNSGNFEKNTLQAKTDFTQLRNKVIVRGANALGSTFSNSQKADGQTLVFFVGYNLQSFSATKDTGGGPASLTVGIDGVDNPASFDCLYNANLGLLRFPSAVTNGYIIAWTGTPEYPILAQVQNDPSIALYGEYQYIIVDRTINSRINARNKAAAEILQYSIPITTGEFFTRTAGLKAGQVMQINSTIRNISGTFKVQKIETTVYEPLGTLYFHVEFVSTVALTMMDVLNRLLIVDPSTQVDTGVNPILDLVGSYNETITFTESFASSLIHNPQSETITVGESFTNNGLNFGTIFVAGAQTPSSTKRVFVLNGSRLG